MRPVMRGWLPSLVSLLAGAILLALPPDADAGLRVVTTLPDLWALTRAVGGDLVEVETVARFGQNPHDMEIRPSQVLVVKRADALVRNGLEEDAWIDAIVESAGNPKLLRGSANVIEAARGIRVLKVPAGPVDRSMGDVHPLGSPHFTLDPANVPTVTATIVEGLARLAPELAERLAANRRAFLERLASADRRWKAMLAPYRGARLVSHHDSWPYFFEAFGFAAGGTLEDRPGVPPSPQHLASLIRSMRDERVRVILVETWYPLNTARLVARETGAQVLVLPQTPGAVKGTEDYIAHLDHLVTKVFEALK